MDATLIRVWGNGAVCYQESINITDDAGHGCLCARTIYASIIYPWEWVNPLMQIGVEYRTTERFWGKPVYYKIVDCGKIADNKQVEHGIAAAKSNGVQFGRPRKPLPSNFEELYQRFRKNEPITRLAKECPEISESTLRLRLQERFDLDRKR